MSKLPSSREAARAQDRVLQCMANIGRWYDCAGQNFDVADLNDEFAEQLLGARTLAGAFVMLSAMQKKKLREMLESPTVDYIYADGRSWSLENLKVLKILEAGGGTATDI